MKEVNGISSLCDSSQPLEQRKRLVKQFHQKRLKFSWDAVLYEQLNDAIHGEGAEKTSHVRRILRTLAAETGEEEDGIEDLWSDVTGQRHPAEEVGETCERAHADLFKSWV